MNKKYYQVYESYTNNPNELLVDGYASHQPILMKLLNSFDKPKVLELGVGYGSTPLIVDNAFYSEHYETDLDWFNKIKDEFKGKKNLFYLVQNHTKFEWLDEQVFEKDWDIVLIDNASGESRQSNLLKLKDKAKFIICHDTEEVYKSSASDYKWDFSSFKYSYVFDKYNTYTTVVSNYQEFKM